MNSNRKRTLLGLAVVMGLGLFAAGTTPAEAHKSGKKKGWHKKQGHKKDHRRFETYHYDRDEYGNGSWSTRGGHRDYGSSYGGDWVHRGRDIDGDGIPNTRDRDIDGDGHPNWSDHKPYGSGYQGRQTDHRRRRR